MLDLAFRDLTFPRLGRRRGGVAPAPVSAIIFGQSEMEHLLNAGSFYRQIKQPTPGDGNLIVYTQFGDGVAPVKTIVNATTVTAGEVNVAMAALSSFLAFAVPGRQFIIGDGAVGGTSRRALADDSTDGTDERLWHDFTSVIDAVEAETGQPVGHLIECWYGSDGGSITTFKASFWPHYFGTDDTGASFTLGTASGGRDVDHCLWDGTAAASAKGRGVFARSATLWHILTPMPFSDAPVAPTAEMENFSENGERLSEPARATMHSLTSDTLAQSVNLRVGPSAHICDFHGGTHPVTDSPDGQILLMWPIAAALLRASGRTINEPQVVAIEGPDNGTYADLLISLPNGGTLTTLAALESRAAYAGSAPHQQAVTGIEISRSNTRRPVYNTSETSYPADFRGTVVIQSASETHVTHGRVGRVRITPTNPFAFGNAISYLRGQATASLQEPRDFHLYPYFLLEHIPDLYDASALYKFPGVAVRPYQEDISVTVPTPSFVARSARFDGGDYFKSSAITVAAGSQGMLSLWFDNQDSSWNATAGRRVFQLRQGTTIVMELITTNWGRLNMRLNNNTATDTISFYAAQPGNVEFVTNDFYHVLMGWSEATGQLLIYVNDVQVATLSLTSLDFDGANLTRIGIGADSGGGTPWLGDLGHLWLSPTQWLDLTNSANRAKFLNGLVPADLGANGELPTGTAPEWYYDGDGAAWANLGTAGNVTLTGALTAGGAPSL